VQDISQLIGYHIEILDSVDSTNNYVANCIQENKLSAGAVIMANFQTKGKGRNNNIWHSKKGENLMFSFFIHPKSTDTSNQFLLHKWITLAICSWLKTFGLDSGIKLPNDIYVKKKKIAGILIENKWQNKGISHSIIGMGINLNQKEWDEGLKLKATSVFNESGINQRPQVALHQLCPFLSHYFRLFQENKEKIDEEFDDFLIKDYLFSYNKVKRERGKILRIANNGMCVFQTDESGFNELMLDNIKLHL